MECVIKSYLTIYLLYMLIACEAYQLCKVPNGDAGTCIRLAKCKPINDLNSKIPKTSDEKLFIQQTLCGNGASSIIKVCCPSMSVWSKFTPKPVIFPDSPNVNKPKPVSVPLNEIPATIEKPAIANPAITGASFIVTPPKKAPIIATPAPAVPNVNPLTITNNGNRNTDDGTLGSRQNSGSPETRPKKPVKLSCGVDSSGANKIKGGTVTEIDQYPWLAILEYSGTFLGCGGSLISSAFVLTAAHCLGGVNGKPVIVRLGEYNLTTFPTDYVEVSGGGLDSVTVTSVPVRDVFPHPDYQKKIWLNDIGIVRLSYSVTFDDFIKTICLPAVDFTPEFGQKTNFTLAGWGTDNQVSVDVKVDVTIPFMSRDKCSKVHERTILDTQICAGGEEGKDSCNGDSGGPLMYQKEKNVFVVGVVSFGKRLCGTAGAPAVYTNVYKFVPWINKIMDDNPVL